VTTTAEPGVTYEGHTRLAELLALQTPLSSSEEEPFFLIAHQAHELWFKALLGLVDRTVSELRAGDPAAAAATLARGTAIVDLLVHHLDVLDTLPAAEFEVIRAAVGSASALQSRQYARLRHRAQDLAAAAGPGLAAALRDYDDAWERWRRRHLATARRLLGDQRGTAGTTGVPFLEARAPQRLFPDLGG